MLNKKDIAILRGMFCELLIENNEIFGRQLKREICDETYSIVNAAVFASEQRLIKRMDEIKEEIIGGITEVIDEGVLPQIEEHRIEIVKIKQHLQLA